MKRSVRLGILCGIGVLMLAVTAWLRFGSSQDKGSPQRPRAPQVRTLDALSLRPWSPPQVLPTPREILAGEGWNRRLKDLIAEADREGGAKGPAFSLKVSEVISGSQADKLGIRPGDHLVAYDGSPILGVQGFNLQRLDQPGRLKLWSKTGGYRDVEVAPGRLGVYFQEEWRPDLAHLASPDRDPRWDDLLRVAALVYEREPATAETALFHAHRAGYRGWVLPALMSVISKSNLRLSDALAYGWIAKGQTPKELLKPVLVAFLESAVAAGASDAALELSRSIKEFNIPSEEWALKVPVDRYRRMTEQDFAGPSPYIAAAGGQLPSVPFVGLDPNGEYIQRNMRGGGGSAFGMAHAKRRMASFIGPALANPGYLLEMDLTPNPESSERAWVQVGLLDISGGRDEELLKVELHPAGQVWVAAHGHPETVFSGPTILKAKGNLVDVAVRGPWCEVRINGACAFLGPVPYRPDREVILSFALRSVDGELLDLQIKNLGTYPAGPAADVARPAAPGPPPTPPERPADPTLAWHYDAMVEGYLKHGSRHPSWDEAAVSALRLAVRHKSNPADLTDIGEIHERAKRAVEAGCDDLQVLGLFDAAHRWATRQPHIDYTPRFRQRLLSGAGAGYSPALRCSLLLQACEARGVANRFPASVDKMAMAALDLLPGAVAEPGVPADFLTRLMSEVARYLPAFKKGPLDAFERVRKIGGESAATKAFEGEFYIEYAWEARGSGWARTVTPDGWKAFRQRLELARTAFEAAWRMDPKHPDVPASMIRVALGHEEVRADLRTWIERAKKATPNNVGAASNLLYFLMPRWHGSRELLLSYGHSAFADAVRNDASPAMGMILLQAHHTIVYPNSFGDGGEREDEFIEASYWRQPEVWKDVRRVFDWIFAKAPGSTYSRSAYAYYAAKCGRWEEARAAFDQLGDSLCFGAFPDRAEAFKLRAEARAHRK